MTPEEWEEMSEMADLKKRLKNAVQADFDIVSFEDEFFPYAVAWAGCTDIAKFQRKADAERFIKTFPKKSPIEHMP